MLIGFTTLALAASPCLIPFAAPAVTASSLAAAWRQSLAGVTMAALKQPVGNERSLQYPLERATGPSDRPAQNPLGEKLSSSSVGDHAGTPTNQVPTRPQLAALQSKLDPIVLHTVTWTSAMTLRVGLIDLQNKSLAADPQKTGVNFIIRSPSKLRPGIREDRWVTNDEFIGSAATAPTSQGLGDLVVLPAFTLTNVSLRHALEVMLELGVCADYRVGSPVLIYTLEERGIVISQVPTVSSPLRVRVFRVDPRAFLRAIRDVMHGPLTDPRPPDLQLALRDLDQWLATNQAPPTTDSDSIQPKLWPIQERLKPSDMPRIRELIRWYFETATGVHFATRVSAAPNDAQFGARWTANAQTIFFHDRAGYLTVRATMEDLDLVEKALEALNLPPTKPAPASGLGLDQSPPLRQPTDAFTGAAWWLGAPVGGQTKPSFFSSERTGDLTVPATLAEVERVEKALEALHAALGNTGHAPASQITTNQTAAPTNPDELLRATYRVNSFIFMQQVEYLMNLRDKASAGAPESRDSRILIDRITPHAEAPGSLPPPAASPERGVWGNTGTTGPSRVLRFQELVRRFFAAATGIPFSAPIQEDFGGTQSGPISSAANPAGSPPRSARTIFLNDRADYLLVRATRQELKLVEAVIEALIGAPAKVNVAITFLRLPNDSELARSKFLPLLRTNGAAVLTAQQTRELLKALEKPLGVELIKLTSITTLSGRMLQATDLVRREILLTTESKATTNAPAPPTETHSVPTGYQLEATPVVLANNSILITPHASFTEFLGYQVPEGAAQPGAHPPTPRFVRWSARKTATLWSGQTLLCGPLQPLPGYLALAPASDLSKPGNRIPLVADLQKIGELSHGTATTQTNRFVLVTATLVDPAGNSINPPADPDSLPPSAEQ